MKKIDTEKTYYTRDELLYRIDRSTNIKSFWEDLMKKRKEKAIILPLLDQSKEKFWFVETDKIKKNVELLDKKITKDLFDIVSDDINIESILLDNLIDEAFNSSVIEGAFSTRKRTKEMVEKESKPKNKSEQMIINNYNALKYVLENINGDFEEKKILDIYKIVTTNTLKEEDKVQKYRNDFVGVWDTSKNDYSYIAPTHSEIQIMMDSLIIFINESDLNPIIKSSILHFYFVYIHPFFDGNGRTARAVSYMYLLQSGYEIFKYFSISSILQEERNKYYNSIENTEKYGSDMTYFIENNLEAMVKSLENMIQKFKEEYGLKMIINIYEAKKIYFSQRELKFLKYMIKSKKSIKINDYKKKFKVSYETARKDLKELSDIGVLKKDKIGSLLTYSLKEDKLFGQTAE